jgi:hypothetical protein
MANEHEGKYIVKYECFEDQGDYAAYWGKREEVMDIDDLCEVQYYKTTYRNVQAFRIIKAVEIDVATMSEYTEYARKKDETARKILQREAEYEIQCAAKKEEQERLEYERLKNKFGGAK